MILSHRITLDPTDKQRRYFVKAAGCARLVWNLALEEWNRLYAAGEKPTGVMIKKAFNEIKYDAFPWMAEVHRDAHSQPFANLQKAFVGFFKGISERPKFHKKGHKDSFYVANDKLVVGDERVRLPLIGWVRMREALRFSGKTVGAVVSRTAQRWFVAIQVDVGDRKKPRTGDALVGVDVGISSALALSTGEKIAAPKPLKSAMRKLRVVNRKLARQAKGGQNFKKTVGRLGRMHARVANIRKDFWHKVTTRLCRENQAIGIETLNVKGMARNKKLARALADVGFGVMAPMLAYKSKIYGSAIHKTDQWFASSKTCSRCGLVKKILGLSERVFYCEGCGLVEDRDMNAAKNEENELKKFLASSDAKRIPAACRESNNACGLGMLVKAPREAGTLRPVRASGTSAHVGSL